MAACSDTSRARFQVTREEHRNRFTVLEDYTLAHVLAGDQISRGIAQRHFMEGL